MISALLHSVRNALRRLPHAVILWVAGLPCAAAARRSSQRAWPQVSTAVW